MTTIQITPDRPPLLCNSCEATDSVCARKASFGGRRCCETCSHLITRTRPPRTDTQ